MTAASVSAREEMVRKGIRLSYLTIAYNVFEALGSLIAGILSGSVALVGFGIDSVIEVTAAGAAQWRLRSDMAPRGRENAERITLRIVGWCFIALAIYVAVDSVKSLMGREEPAPIAFGLVVLVLSVIVMPLLARAKRRVAVQMKSGALEAESRQTSLCAYLSLIALVGVGLNGVIGCWWADPVAALTMVPIITKEGIDGLRAQVCEECAPLRDWP